jgi:serine protease AprX
MELTKKSPKPIERGERHSAAWGKRVSLMLLLATGMSFGQSRLAPEFSGFFSKDKKDSADDEKVKVIVQYKQLPSSANYSAMQGRGAHLNAKLHGINAAAFTIPAKALSALANDPDVALVTLDHTIKGMDDYTDAAMSASTAWNSGYNGRGIGVAVIDSGINDSHADLWDSTLSYSRVVYHQDFTGTSLYSNGRLLYDTYGHGTHVAGIIGGNGYKSNGRFAGVAPSVNLVDLRVLDSSGSGSDSMVIAAIQQAIALKNTYNIKVINLSLGRGISLGYTQDPLCQAVESAWRAGIVVVVAAGNFGRISVNGSNGYGTVAAPGNDPLVLTVGAMKAMGTYSRSDDQIASYSSKGPTTYDHVVKPDVVAPGNVVVSLDAHWSTLEGQFPANTVSGNSSNHDYFILSGTSMATPAVAGGVALLLQKDPTLTPDQIKARLMKTAYKTFPTSTTAFDSSTGQTYTSYYDLFTVGAGYVDLAAALANTDRTSTAVGAALSPSAAYNSNGSVTLSNGNTIISPSSVVWGTSVVWGSSVVWGTNVSGSSVVWGTSLVWGTSITSGFSVVWGTSTGTSATSVVWGTSSLDGNGAFSGTDVEQ